MASRQPPPRSRPPQLPRDQIPPPPPRLPEYIPLEQQAARRPEYVPLPELPPEWPDEQPEAPVNPMACTTTIVEEQRERSLEIQRMGPAAYMAQFDTRTAEDMNQTVAGVGNTQVTEAELRR